MPTASTRCRGIRPILVILVLALSGLVTVAQAQDTPTSVPGAKTVTADQVIRLLVKGAKLYDLRTKAAYAKKHIPGAIHVTYDEMSVKAVSYDPSADSFDLAQLPSDKKTPVAFHVQGVDGWTGYKAAAAAVKAGYKNVYFFRGGFAEWIAKGLPTEERRP